MLSGCTGGGDPSPPQATDPATGLGPDWSFEDIEGTVHSRETSLGNASVLFFMATWCSSCRQNAPRLADVHEEFGPLGLQTYSLSWDLQEDRDDLRRWMSDYDQFWPHGLDPGNDVAQAFGVTQQSSIVVLDAEGIMVKGFGYPGASKAQLRAAVQEAMGDGSAA